MPRKLPALTDENRAFWQGGQKDELLIHRCSDCGRYFHPPGPVCPVCNSFEVGPEAVSGRGHVVSFTINHQPWTSELEKPFVIAVVELVEQPGLRFVSNIEGVAVTDVYIGMPVRVQFHQEEDVWLPLFVGAKHV